MRKAYKILYREGTGELIEKKSRFIASFRSVKTEEEAQSFIEEMRKKYWDASHNCYAWVLGENGEGKRCSDDGEPSQTAGKPMLDVLEGEGIVNICVVVTRYFGGTLLGTGGLVRAYSGAVKEGLKACTVLTLVPAKKLLIDTDYNGSGKIQYLLSRQNIAILNSDYTDRVIFTALVPDEEMLKLQADITEATGGKAKLEVSGFVYYSMLEKEVLLFPEL
ncbi:YigZ family protein [Lacrimispora amygdalina]|uniref:YigZ family protein n=1 Tax=Lacrimispora amygdalina TaxID=253257 RepID=A0A3E2N444_9FIRM|nr:YigZ family protein [Clostridium indicum]RFZ75770.1 YigZ family protein [Clostridium indicum]